MRRISPNRLVLAGAVVATTLAAAPLAPTAAGAASCDRLAAARGSDGAAGTPSSPFRTAQKLVRSLAPGQTGCLAAGEVFDDGRLRVDNGGAPGQPITIRSEPGGRATIRGRIWVTPEGSDVVFTDLNLDGRNSGGEASPEIHGDRVEFRGNDITNRHTGICFVIGISEGSYKRVARGAVVAGNRIHDCGVLPATNGDHGIYVESSSGARIVDNYIYDNADRGVQLFPDAQGTLVANNVIDGNGQGVVFGGWRGFRSNNNAVRRNIITNSRIRSNIESWWESGTGLGSGNVAEDNCVFGGAGSYGNIAPSSGFVARGNRVANPGYVNRAAKDFRLAPGSPCAGFGPGGAPAAGPSTPSSGPRPSSRRPRLVRRPRVLGVARQGRVVRCGRGRWSNGPARFRVRWLVNGRVQASGRVSYRLRRSDVGRRVTCRVIASNARGRTGAVAAARRVAAHAGAPKPRRGPSIRGLAQVGARLTCARGLWTRSPRRFLIQWVRDGAAVRGARRVGYRVPPRDAGSSLRCRVVAVNRAGPSLPSSSPPVRVIRSRSR